MERKKELLVKNLRIPPGHLDFFPHSVSENTAEFCFMLWLIHGKLDNRCLINNNSIWLYQMDIIILFTEDENTK